MFVTGQVQAQEEDFNSITSQREEIQRYFGYEILPFRYLSLPYDVTVNNNERAVFLDIGMLYFMFLPLLLLLYFSKRSKSTFYLCLAVCLLVLILSCGNSFVFSKSAGEVKSTRSELSQYLLGDTGFLTEPISHFSAYIYYLISFIHEPLNSLTSMVSGSSDYITYPLLLGLFMLSLVLLRKLIYEKSLRDKILIIVFWCFFFYWIKYSAGIIWYGFVNLILCSLIGLKLYQKEVTELKWTSQFLKILIPIVSIFWIVSAIALRMGEVQNNLEASDLGKSMFNPVFFRYQVGEYNANDVLNSFYPQFDKALSRMNSDSESLILRIGTSFTYFIKNNSERVLMDNQLGIFNILRNKYEDDDVLIDVLKASNFKYIIVDVNTPFIDKTPEGSLRKKYKKLRRFIRGNTNLKLLCTNRIIQETDPQTRQVKNYYRMFPEPDTDSKVYYGGQYAIYEII